MNISLAKLRISLSGVVENPVSPRTPINFHFCKNYGPVVIGIGNFCVKRIKLQNSQLKSEIIYFLIDIKNSNTLPLKHTCLTRIDGLPKL